MEGILMLSFLQSSFISNKLNVTIFYNDFKFIGFTAILLSAGSVFASFHKKSQGT